MRIANLDGRAVILIGEHAVDVERASGGAFAADPQAVYDRWPDFLAWAAGADLPVGEPYDPARLGPPVPRPGQIFGIGLNYREHAAEAGFPAPTEPPVFTKFLSSLAGPQTEVALPTATVDWEAELVVVIGRPAHRVTAAAAWSYVAGLTVGQDLSERTRQAVGPAAQFSLGKSFPGFAPIGPCLVTLDEIERPDDLELGCTLNGEQMQKSRTSDLIFSVPVLIERLSAVLPLAPGDLIFTGTPSGVGAGRKPPQFLAPGDELVTRIEGLGELRQRFVAGTPHVTVQP
jgi:2-keto-4-pentenoate hydratase/2-oxohepta-3-ene-1,7-dioic acid hydratase in catechol pathway